MKRLIGLCGTMLLLILLPLSGARTPTQAQESVEQRSPLSALLYGEVPADERAPAFGASFASAAVRPAATGSAVKQFEETAYYLQDVDFVSANVGWAVGLPHWNQATKNYVGTILHTVDGGETWTPQAAGVGESLKAVDFIDANRGWAVGASGTILRTTDGGVHWARQTVATTDEFLAVSFVDANQGWATTVRPTSSWFGEEDNWAAAVWHTSNGGTTWTQQTIPASASILHDVEFVDALQGWAVGVRYIGNDGAGRPQHRATIYRTTNGGQTWVEQYAPDLEISLTAVDFVNATHGWAAGFPTRSSVTGGFVFHTTNGGQTWQRQEPGGFYAPLWDIRFTDQNHGYAVGFDYAGAWGPPVWRTLDGGTTWTKVRMERHDNEGLFAVAIVGSRVIAIGDHDYIIRSERAWDPCTPTPPESTCYDCECLFEQAYLNTHYLLHDVFFADVTHGWAVGSRSLIPEIWGQVIMNTVDGGTTWQVQYAHDPPLDQLFSYHRLDSVTFVDSQKGWAVGTSTIVDGGQHYGAIWYTGNGGSTWTAQGQELYASWDLEFFAVQFLNEQQGWALATRNFPSENIFLAHTTNGGTTWQWVDTGIAGPIAIGFEIVQGGVSWTDALHGWAAGGLGKIVHTEDGGLHWTPQTLSCDYPSCPYRTLAIEFLDPLEGWLVGEEVYHTTDGGAHWNPHSVDIAGDVQDIQFLDGRVGWMASDQGALRYTSDGGNRWQPVASGTMFALRGLHFVAPAQGWIVGDAGVILHYDSEYLPVESEVFLPVVQKQ